MPRPARRPDPRALGESARWGAAASGASAQTARLIGPVGAPRATGSRSAYCPPCHRVVFIRRTVGYGKSRFTRAGRKHSAFAIWPTADQTPRLLHGLVLDTAHDGHAMTRPGDASMPAHTHA